MLYLSLTIQLDERIEPPGEDYQLSKQDNGEQYAIKVDTNSPVDDFHEKIPNMAYKVLNIRIQWLTIIHPLV